MEAILESIFHTFFEIAGITFLVIFLFNKIIDKMNLRNKVNASTAGAFLGVIPGCAGALSSSIMYINGNATFGFLIASLIATMGDGAYILISQKPKEFLIITSIAFLAAIICGAIAKKFNIKITKSQLDKKIELPKKIKYGQKHIFNIFNKYLWRIFMITIPIITLFAIGHTVNFIPHNIVHSSPFEIFVLITAILMIINSVVIDKLKTCKIRKQLVLEGKYFLLEIEMMLNLFDEK